MYKFFLIFILAITIISCSKNKETTKPLSNPVTLPDSIVYTKCDTTVSLNTIRYLTPSIVPYNCEDLATPADSSAFLNIDLSGDSIPDFRLTGFHNPVTNFFCGSHCSCTDIYLNISGYNAGDSISINNSGNPVTLFSYDTLTEINNTGKWSSNAYLNFLVHGVGSYYFSEMYIGIKKNNNFGWIHIAPKNYNGAYIKEYGFNLTSNNSIIAGQKL